MNPRDLKTQALVLRRTNYGEADRVVHFLTPEGQVAVMAKGVRKARSKLAGGIEMFCLSEITVHQGKAKLGVLTSAKPLRFYQHILTDWQRLELAASTLKALYQHILTDWQRLELAASTLKALGKFEGIAAAEFFQIGKTSLEALDQGLPCDLVEAWLALRLATARGEEVNLYCDVTGTPLQSDLVYEWDPFERGLRPQPQGAISADQIKLMRLLVTSSPQLVAKVKNLDTLLPPVLQVARSLN